MILFSCKKENTHPQDPCGVTIIGNHSNDTIFPSPYLMTYPGSWWAYTQGMTDSCQVWESVDIINTVIGSPCPIMNKDVSVLPYLLTSSNFHGLTHISYDTRIILSPNYYPSKRVKLLDTVPGITHFSEWSGGSGSTYHDRTLTVRTLERFDSIYLANTWYYDVIHTEEIDSIYFYHMPGGPVNTNEYYYARNIGMVRKIYWQGVTFDLTNHYIAPY